MSLDELGFVGSGLNRPECVAVTAKGDIFASDQRGGIAHMQTAVDGRVSPPRFVLAQGEDKPSDFMTNGFAVTPNRRFLIANLANSGGVYDMDLEGKVRPFLLEIHGKPMPPVNFVNRDEKGRVWISVSTWLLPRDLAFKRDTADGFIVLVDARGARLVADGIGYTNENKLHPSGDWLYVNETVARRLSRYRVAADGSLGQRQTVTEFDDGVFPDGLAFDVEGGVWIASVVSNRLVRVSASGVKTILVDDSDEAGVERAERNYADDQFSRKDIDAGRDGVLGNLASVTFGGPDLKTVYMGSLFSDKLATFQSPIAGATPPHWHY